LPVRKPSYAGTTAAERDHPPPNHAGHLGNANLLATTSHSGLLTNFVKSRNKKKWRAKIKAKYLYYQLVKPCPISSYKSCLYHPF
jgi:hypothetical protein